MSKVYIVNSGEYSDWNIDAAFSTLEKAKTYRDSSDYFHDNIIEMEIDKPNDFPIGKKAYRVSFRKDGTCYCNSVEPEKVDNKTNPTFHDMMVTTCWATDKKHAIKIANERRVQIIANNKWDTDVAGFRRLQRNDK